MHELKFLGSNSLSAKGLFYTRKAYKDYAIPSGSLRMMDYWYGDSLYGKVDLNNDVVYPLVDQTSVLEPIPENTETVLAMFFVSRQIEKLKQEYQALLEISQDTIKPLPAYSDFQVQRSYVSIEESYERNFNEVLSYFVMEYLPSYSKCITEFKHIVKHYKMFVGQYAEQFPITKTSYIMMPSTTSLSTGLVVDLAHAQPSVDAPKEQFFPECDFAAFQALAASNGFLVNKNSPWRLTYNIKSDIIRKQDGALEDIFGKYYFKSHFFDMHSVFRFLLNAYKLFFRKNPNIFYPYENRQQVTENLVKKRKYKKDFFMEYEINDWLDLTYWTRLSELGLKESSEVLEIYQEKPWPAMLAQSSPDDCLTLINERVKAFDPRLTMVHTQEIRNNKGYTSWNSGHEHSYEVDEHGNGWTTTAHHPGNKNIAHRHKIVSWQIQEAKSSCYPHCEEIYSDKGLSFHDHEMSRS